ncbi:zinc ribbon domain-containing protein [Natrononativus amylolyticus]|uniref:zinc ribbon domain-containing protein n=1 Tax=Natrononativus amylolyticus TaxID=2963434 RepID=UPI0020CCDCBA|nr:zinc ribbon domain-containing protein [Natrononativus amylolyticus]
MRSARLQREIDDLVARGWRIEQEDRDRVVMVDREFGSLGSHLLVALLTIWWTMGIGNVLWGAYNYATKTRRQVLWEEAVGCPNCGADVAEDADYCWSCGTELGSTAPANGIVCPECEAVLREGARYCRACGTKLADSASS